MLVCDALETFFFLNWMGMRKCVAFWMISLDRSHYAMVTSLIEVTTIIKATEKGFDHEFVFSIILREII